MLQIGELLDIKIGNDDQPLYIVGVVTGIKEDSYDRDVVMVRLRHLDNWIALDKDVRWEVIK